MPIVLIPTVFGISSHFHPFLVAMKLTLSYPLLLTAVCSIEAAKPSFSGSVKAVLDKQSLHQREGLLVADVQQNAVATASEALKTTDMTDNLHVRGGASTSSIENLTICFYFFTWYALNVVYNSKLVRDSSINMYVCCRD
jgi:hypothetical protein